MKTGSFLRSPTRRSRSDVPMDMFYHGFKRAILDGSLDLENDTIKVLLLSDIYVPQPGHKTRADLAGEISGPGYKAGGQVLTGKRIDVSPEGKALFSADNALWTPASIKARAAVIYKAA